MILQMSAAVKVAVVPTWVHYLHLEEATEEPLEAEPNPQRWTVTEKGH